MTQQLLLVEDDFPLGSSLKEGLEARGFSVTWAKSLAEARKALGHSPAADFQLAILDISLPDGSGFDLAQEILAHANLPLLLMTALNSAENRLTGYELGAQEFIPKPFHFRELTLRIDHVLANHRSATRIALQFGSLDLDKMCIEYTDGRTSFISSRDFRVLQLLIQRTPRPVSRDEMLELIWGEDQFPTQRTVDNCIVRLRQMLLDEDGHLIRSVRGVGYQWVGGSPS